MEQKIKIWVANLALYNNGIKFGQWFTLPDVTPKEIENKLKLGQGTIEFNGSMFSAGEEYIILDAESPVKIGEYDSLSYLYELAVKLENIDQDLFKNLNVVTEYETIDELVQSEGEHWEFYPDVANWKEYVEYLANEVGGIQYLVSKEQMESYFDYDSFGRDVSIETSGEFCSGGLLIYRN